MIKRYLLLLLVACLSFGTSKAQTSDSLIVNRLRAEGVKFSHNNTVTLLMNGQEKFDDMFKAIRQARSSVHLEYFNFRNDSIASLLFDILAEKASQGVEVRALFDGFGNDSNNCKAVNHLGVKWDDAASKEDQLARIQTQKYIALFPLSNEGWAEQRRTSSGLRESGTGRW